MQKPWFARRCLLCCRGCLKLAQLELNLLVNFQNEILMFGCDLDPVCPRSVARFTLPRAGEVLTERSRSLIRDAQLAVDKSRSAMRGEAGPLRIGFGLPSLATGLPDFFQRFRRRFPAVHISMREMSTPPQLEALKNRTLDVGFVRLPIQAGEISVFHRQ